MKEYGVILFFTTSSAIRAEKLLAKEGYTIKLIPTPRQFSSVEANRPVSVAEMRQ